MPSKIQVLVLSDDPLARTSIRLLIKECKDLQLVGETANLPELPVLWAKTKPHILLIGGGDTAFFHEVFLLAPASSLQTRLMVMLQSSNIPSLSELLQIPIHGCCLKTEINESFIDILRGVARGATAFSRNVLENQSVWSIHEALAALSITLSEKEEQIVVLITRGLTNGEIAAEVDLARQTVSNYIKTIYSKIGTNQRMEIMRRFYGTVFVPWDK